MIRWVVNSIACDLYGNTSRPHSVEGRRTLNSETRWEWLWWQAAGSSCSQCLGPQVSRERLTGHPGHGVQEGDGHPAWSLKLKSAWVNTLEPWVRKPEAGPWVRSLLVPLRSDPEKLPQEHTLSLPLPSWTWAEAVNQGAVHEGNGNPDLQGVIDTSSELMWIYPRTGTLWRVARSGDKWSFGSCLFPGRPSGSGNPSCVYFSSSLNVQLR